MSNICCANCKYWEGVLKYKYPERLMRREQCLHPYVLTSHYYAIKSKWTHTYDDCPLYKTKEEIT